MLGDRESEPESQTGDYIKRDQTVALLAQPQGGASTNGFSAEAYPLV
jgi:hypothetical protein